MWSHLKENQLRSSQISQTSKLPVKRYYKVVCWIAMHASLDIIALIGFSIARLADILSPADRQFLDYITQPVVAFHVACYPFVYCG